MCAMLVDGRQFRQFMGFHSFDRTVLCRKLGSKEIHMSTTTTIRSDFYHVPLTVVLTDSTHGEITGPNAVVYADHEPGDSPPPV
jgi:hypothetical protein